jgi:hypothetical protein
MIWDYDNDSDGGQASLAGCSGCLGDGEASRNTVVGLDAGATSRHQEAIAPCELRPFLPVSPIKRKRRGAIGQPYLIALVILNDSVWP